MERAHRKIISKVSIDTFEIALNKHHGIWYNDDVKPEVQCGEC